MKAITISQPFASLIASGEKWVENRFWPTNYRGQLAIHAGKGLQYLTKEQLKSYPSGRVIAVANLSACVHESANRFPANLADEYVFIPGTSRTWADFRRHRYTEGPWCWILEDVRKIEPVEVRGMQGLWNLPEGLLGK